MVIDMTSLIMGTIKNSWRFQVLVYMYPSTMQFPSLNENVYKYSRKASEGIYRSPFLIMKGIVISDPHLVAL